MMLIGFLGQAADFDMSMASFCLVRCGSRGMSELWKSVSVPMCIEMRAMVYVVKINKKLHVVSFYI